MENTVDKTELKYCLYARKSSESDERQAMSIDSQIKEMSDLARKEGIKIVKVVQESYSAKQSGQRPVFMQLLTDIRLGEVNGLLTWAPDRLSRNAGDLGSLVDLMDDKKLVQIRTYSQSFTNTPSEKFMLMILCSQAKLENDNKGENVKRGIRAKCEMGWRPCMPPIGYYNRAMAGIKDVVVDPDRGPFITKMFEHAAKGESGRTIKAWLDRIGATSRKGKPVTLSLVYLMLKNPFYYGTFEYPIGSGTWYKGAHEPLITKELFDKAQKQLNTTQKAKWGSKEFPFRRFLTCYSCGSTIVGEEKFKTLKNGKKNRHIYYHCSRAVDHNCKEMYLSETQLIEALLVISDKLTVDKVSMEPGLTNAIHKFYTMLDTVNQKKKYTKSETIKNYAKYVLEKGTDFERTQLVRNLNVKLAVHDRKIVDVSGY
ncbi:MAG: recombinase family protein [Dehalococcoidales bacterium]|nr:recombinase family protein [Dehalococcoidales bacterium]